jgi:ATP-dependent Clp protease ATP-binding subunit ClpX
MHQQVKSSDQLQCSFCEKDQNTVSKLIGGPHTFICEMCVQLCMEILREDSSHDIRMEGKDQTPRKIYDMLSEYVISQDHAKRILSVAIYMHYLRLNYMANTPLGTAIEIQKSNILLIGPSGSGKTFLAQIVAKILNIPFVIVDATSLTQAGYVGEDVENILVKLLRAADHDLEKAQRGIIYIDEVDKISRKGENPSITRDVSGEGVQQALLKIIEGSIASIPQHGGRKHPQQEYISFDTQHVLVIAGGAFSGMDKIIKERLSKKGSIGFGKVPIKGDLEKEKEHHELFSQITTQDFIKFGMIPEFMGRFPVIVSLDSLTKEDLRRLLTEPKNAIMHQYSKIFELHKQTLEFTSEALDAVVQEAIHRKTGARGLRSVLESILHPYIFDLPDHPNDEKLIITNTLVHQALSSTVPVKEDISGD